MDCRFVVNGISIMNKNKILTLKLNQLGFSTLPEITFVMGILIILMSIGIYSLARAQHSSSLATTLDTFKSDFKNQQLKAMLGDTETGSAPDNYGIHFDTTSYTLFKGTWSASASSNFVINLPSTIQISDFFPPSHEAIFSKGKGEVSGCDNFVGCKVTFNDVSLSIGTTIIVNQMGAITVN